jgi:aryl-alcohol dehydrogenase-like predicted oxidoreductase
MNTIPQTLPGGTWMLGDLDVTRFGYGAMQLAGPGVMGPPKDRDAAIAVLRAAVDAGVTHIDTAGSYGPNTVNEIIREALYPYASSLHVVTKVGAVRDDTGAFIPARGADDIGRAVEENLRTLGLDVLDVVNLRAGNARGPQPEDLSVPMEALVELQRQGIVRHLGVSNVTAEQVSQAQSFAPIVCVQNAYNLAYRADDALIDQLADQGVAYVPFFPLGGGFTPYVSGGVPVVAERHGTSEQSVALSWLLHRSPNILVIAGTSSVAHLQENIVGAGLALTEDDLALLAG